MKRLATAFCAAAFLFACNSQDKVADEPRVASAASDAKITTEAWVPVDSDCDEDNDGGGYARPATCHACKS